MKKPPALDRLKVRFDKDGFIVLREFLANSEMQELNQTMENFIKERIVAMLATHVFCEDKDDPSSLRQMQDLHHYDGFFQNLLVGSRFEKIASILLAGEVIPKNIEFFNKPPRIGRPTPPHQDNYYFMLSPPEALTMWLALEEVDEVNGFVRHLRGSHLQGMRPHSSSHILGFSQVISDYNKQDYSMETKVPARAGDLLIHHAMTVHRADGNKSMEHSRKALGFIYFSASAIEDVAAKESYRITLANKKFRSLMSNLCEPFLLKKDHIISCGQLQSKTENE